MIVSELVFDRKDYLDIDRARIHHLDLLNIGCQGKTLLDVGCGIGRFSDYWTSKGCKVLGIDARETNIKVMRERYPHIHAAVANVESESFPQMGAFDIVFCYGLLYHTENPTLVLRNLLAVTQHLLILETVITVSPESIVNFVLEPPEKDQAVRGIACRPSERYLMMVLSQCAFQYIYMPTVWPEHSEFSRRAIVNGKLTRTIIVASRKPIENLFLSPATEKLFVRQMGQLEYFFHRVAARVKRLME
jgi:SAM-dependent methyltransferase